MEIFCFRIKWIFYFKGNRNWCWKLCERKMGEETFFPYRCHDLQTFFLHKFSFCLWCLENGTFPEGIERKVLELFLESGNNRDLVQLASWKFPAGCKQQRNSKDLTCFRERWRSWNFSRNFKDMFTRDQLLITNIYGKLFLLIFFPSSHKNLIPATNILFSRNSQTISSFVLIISWAIN